MLINSTKAKSPDLILLFAVIGLALFGLAMVYNASVAEAWQWFGDKYHFVKLQALWLGIGLTGMALAIFIPLGLVEKTASWWLAVTLILLVAVLVPGLGNQALGARRWLNLGGFSLQPTELTKLTLGIYLSAWLVKRRPLAKYLLILGLVLGLVMLQPDLGTAIVIILSSVIVYFISGAEWRYLLLLSVLAGLSGIGLIYSSAYRRARLLTWLNPAQDPLGSSYHIRQALITIGSGGLWGLGLGQSRQKYQFLPQVTTDSIFAVIAEELGFFLSALVIVWLFLIIYRGLRISHLAADGFSRLLAAGISGWLGVQAVVNLSSMLALLPLTGVPLPFVSYGGSSLIISLIGTGLLLNISRFRLNPKKNDR
jgi:cell division protein FtsW